MLGAGLLKNFAQNLMRFHDRENGASGRFWQANFARRFFQTFRVTLAWRRGKSIAYEEFEMLF
jgi:hypothetical protein